MGCVSPRFHPALTRSMNENDDLIHRLAGLGQQPVDPDVAARHLSTMTPRPGRQVIAHKLRVAGAFALGLFVGATGLASAGALPDPMQEVAHHTLGAVGVDVPRADRYNGSECAGGPFKNHGEYVRSQPKESRPEAAASRCGKPVQAGTGDEGEKAPKPGGVAGECQGPPSWAGKGNAGKDDKAAKQAEQAARKAACGDDDADAPEDQKVDDPSAARAATPEESDQGEDEGDEPASTTTTATTAPAASDDTSTTTTSAGGADTDEDEATTTTTTAVIQIPGTGIGS